MGGIAVGASLVFYGKQAQADAQIHALCADKDHMMRMAGCHTIATAYAGTNDNAMIKILLHIAVSDVNGDTLVRVVQPARTVWHLHGARDCMRRLRFCRSHCVGRAACGGPGWLRPARCLHRARAHHDAATNVAPES